MDDFLGKRLSRYDRWLSEEKISFSSKVIPVGESLEAIQWILPSEQVLGVLKNARTIALQNCECRTHYSRCSKPLEVCFVLNDAGDKLIEKGSARRVSIEVAAEILRKADESGLVHMSLFVPDHEITALCNCCPCCCHDIQLLKLLNRKDLIARSEYVAATDADTCIHCGACVERCPFDARKMCEGEMTCDPAACLGCGLCVTVCPVDATAMKPRSRSALI